MKRLIFILMVLLSFLVEAEEDIFIDDSENIKVETETIITDDGDEKELKRIIGYYPGMEIEYIAECVEGSDKEKWTWFYPEGIVKLTGTRSSNGNIGKWTRFYRNGKIKTEIYFNDSGKEIQNMYSDYYSNGDIRLKITPTLLEGYDTKGNLETKKEYKVVSDVASIPDGKYEEYIQGKLVLKGKYKDGKKDGEWIWYDDLGKPEYRAVFDNDVLKENEDLSN